MSVTILEKDKFRRECFEAVLNSWREHFPHEYKEYFWIISRFKEALRDGSLMSDDGTIMTRTKIPARVRAMINTNCKHFKMRPFMSGTQEDCAKDLYLFLKAAEYASLRAPERRVMVPKMPWED